MYDYVEVLYNKSSFLLQLDQQALLQIKLQKYQRVK